uniref:Retrovirus-related Pol polyprotein LINE-1 n=1 Tax=Tanacetum cinerariifolium TaxID=118510 RepID=A0A6L2MMB8_TANCI|nr:hypothetical protein [Tanacetum cinerariifolium]
MTKPYSSHRFIANCFIAGNFKKEVEASMGKTEMEEALSIKTLLGEDGRSITLISSTDKGVPEPKKNKAVGPDEILIEAWRCLGGEGVWWLTTLFNKTFLRAKIPNEWRLSERKALEDKGLRVSREKTEYLRCNFNMNERDRNEEEEIQLDEHILELKESFRYLGSVMHESRRIKDDVTHHIQVGWLKWRAATGILYDKKVPLKLKGKFYKSFSDKSPSSDYRQQDERRTIEMVWHVKRRPQSIYVRRLESLTVDGARRRGRPKLRWEDRLKTDLKEMLLSEDMTSDRNAWRTRIRVIEGT